jgi:hypothetical protein
MKRILSKIPRTYLSRREDGKCTVLVSEQMACVYLDRAEAEATYRRIKSKDCPERPWVWCHIAAKKAFDERIGGDGLHGWVEGPSAPPQST